MGILLMHNRHKKSSTDKNLTMESSGESIGIKGTPTSKLYLIPLTLTVVYPFTCLLTYAWAVLAGHINPLYSYISDGGTTPPEMCVFGQLLHIVCILYFGVVYIRYHQVKLYYKWKYNKQRSKLNAAGLINGLLSILGVSLVANFQETSVLAVHVFGAWLVFMCGNVWGCIQAYLSFKLLPSFSSRPMAYLRTGLGATGLVLFIIFQIAGTVSYFQFNGMTLSGRNMLKQQHDDTGWVRGTAVVVEWIMSSFFVVFVATFIWEFKQLRYKGPEIFFTEELQAMLHDQGHNCITTTTTRDDDEPGIVCKNKSLNKISPEVLMLSSTGNSNDIIASS